MDQQQKPDRDAEQEKFARRFIIIPYEVMMDERLTLADKLVFGRALNFHQFFESVEHTAAFIGISIDQARKSKQKLEKLGLLRCYQNDGRGKRYTAELDMSKLKQSQSRQRRLAENHNAIGKINQSDWENQPTENKESLKGAERLSFEDKSSKGSTAPDESAANDPLKDEQPKRYGNAEVNDALDLWEQQTGFSHHSTKSERFAISGLIKQYGYEATKALILRVGRARRSRDRYAPQIAKPSQLRGKYSKLEALTIWEQRRDAESSDGPNLRKLYETPREYLEERDPTAGKTKEELHAETQAIREQYRGTPYEHIFCRRSKEGN